MGKLTNKNNMFTDPLEQNNAARRFGIWPSVDQDTDTMMGDVMKSRKACVMPCEVCTPRTFASHTLRDGDMAIS